MLSLVVLQTSTQSSTFVLSHEITTSFLEKDIILISVRDTNIYFRLKNLQVNHLRENLPLLSSKTCVENLKRDLGAWSRDSNINV